MGPEQFSSYYDYFLFLHLDARVRWMHVAGMALGAGIFVWALVEWNWMAFLAGYAPWYGFGWASHWIFDGVPSRTAREAPWRSFVYALAVNLLTLGGRWPAVERDLRARYPLTADLYPI